MVGDCQEFVAVIAASYVSGNATTTRALHNDVGLNMTGQIVSYCDATEYLSGDLR